MSRFGECDDYDTWYPNQNELWQANVNRALSGKRGRKALAELREALLALPEPRLISGALCTVGGLDRPDVPALQRPDPEDQWNGHRWNNWRRESIKDKLDTDGEGVCAIGAFLWHKKVKAGADPRAAFEDLPMLLDEDGGSDHETAAAGQRAGLTYTLASTLAYRNDESFAAMTPERRYQAFVGWIDEQLAGSPS